ncbi:hypothetical protein ABPG72_005312 [Tetrahymena utriculariae]
MFYGGNNAPQFKLDNTQIRNETQYLIEKGRRSFNEGDTIEEKDKGISTFLQGLKKLELWIQRETEPQIQTTLKAQYQNNYKEVETMLTKLEQIKKNGNQPMAIAQGGGGGNNNNAKDENSKFKEALQDTIVPEKPNVKWDDIAGLVKAKESLKEAVILPIRFPEIFKGARKPWKGILLYGPPGTGKTYLAKACATETEGTFFSVSSADLVSKYVGESEKLIKNLFALAREKKPSIIFIDEVDSLCGNRSDGENEASRRVKTEFLVQMQGVGNDDQGVLVLGATNLPWALDPAIRRRFEKRIYIPLPDQPARKFLLKHNLKTTPNTLQEEDFDRLSQQTEGFSGADMSIFVRDAVLEPVRKLQVATKFKKLPGDKYMPVDDNATGSDIVSLNYLSLNQQQLELPQISAKDFAVAVKKVKPSVGQEQLKDYEKWTTEFGQDG